MGAPSSCDLSSPSPLTWRALISSSYLKVLLLQEFIHDFPVISPFLFLILYDCLNQKFDKQRFGGFKCHPIWINVSVSYIVSPIFSNLFSVFLDFWKKTTGSQQRHCKTRLGALQQTPFADRRHLQRTPMDRTDLPNSPALHHLSSELPAPLAKQTAWSCPAVARLNWASSQAVAKDGKHPQRRSGHLL